MTSIIDRGNGADRLAWACCGLLAFVFLYAAVPKLIDLDAFVSIIDAYGILPDRFLFPVAVTLVCLEVIGAVGLFFKSSRMVSLSLLLCLLLVFIAMLSYGLWLGLDIDCGCFGAADPEYAFFHNLKVALVRDLFLLLPVAYLYWHGWLNRLKMREEQNDYNR